MNAWNYTLRSRHTSDGCTCAGVRSGRLLSWQERLAALRDLGLWEHALWLGLHIFTAAQSHITKVCHPTVHTHEMLLMRCTFQGYLKMCCPLGQSINAANGLRKLCHSS